MASSDQLDSLLDEYKLSEEYWGKQITGIDQDKISWSCGFPCERLSSYLGVEQACAQDIKHDGKSEPERRAALLKTWDQKKGSGATYKALIAALLEIEHKNDAEVVCKLLKTSMLATPCSTSVMQTPSASSKAPSG